MKINISEQNLALISIFKNPNQIITVDANFLIPPNRDNLPRVKGFSFLQYKVIWLDIIFHEFSNIAIHEAVLDELVTSTLRDYIDTLSRENPPKVIIHKDTELTEIEKILRDSIEEKLYPYTKYDPNLNNKDDRGEVKSLAYIAVKGLIYFATADNNALNIINNTDKWSTGLDNVKAIQMYEIIFYLYSKNLCDKNSLRMLYRYQYFLTEKEKKNNPEWGVFTKAMFDLYLG